MITYMLGTEVLGILFPKDAVEVFTRFCKFFRTTHAERIVGDVNDTLKVRHLIRRKFFPRHITYKQEACIRVVDNIVHLLRFEFVKDGHCNGTISECSDESNRPMRTIATAKCNLIALFYTRIFEKNVKFLNLARHIVILQGLALVVG